MIYKNDPIERLKEAIEEAIDGSEIRFHPIELIENYISMHAYFTVKFKVGDHVSECYLKCPDSLIKYMPYIQNGEFKEPDGTLG